jgi:hypothetical protein
MGAEFSILTPGGIIPEHNNCVFEERSDHPQVSSRDQGPGGERSLPRSLFRYVILLSSIQALPQRHQRARFPKGVKQLSLIFREHVEEAAC